MKQFLPFLFLALVIVISTISAILYLNESYIFSAVLTIIWVVGASYWIGGMGNKLKQLR